MPHQRVLRHAIPLHQLRGRPAGDAHRPVDLLYPHPDVGATFTDFPQIQRIWHEEIPGSPEDLGDGVSAATDPCSLYRLMPTAVRSAAAGG
jgi:hypothetical protein